MMKIYRYAVSEISDDNLGENTRDTTSEEDGDEEEYDQSLFESTVQSRVKNITTGKVSRTREGSTSGVLVPLNDPLYESIGHQLSENCFDFSCLSTFNTDEIYQFHLNLLEMTKEEKSMLLLGKLHVLSKAVTQHRMHARKEQSMPVLHTTMHLIIKKCASKPSFFFMI